jgi:hypothetical protein
MLPKRDKTNTETMCKHNTKRKSMEMHKYESHSPEPACGKLNYINQTHLLHL